MSACDGESGDEAPTGSTRLGQKSIYATCTLDWLCKEASETRAFCLEYVRCVGMQEEGWSPKRWLAVNVERPVRYGDHLSNL